MNPYNIDKLSNNIKVITRNNPNTPRIAVNLFMASGAKNEKLAGTASLTSRLLLQGTTTKSAEELANVLDSNAIELSVETKQDYLRARAQSLNEDFCLAVDLLEDTIKNSTFENIEKERVKFTGELRLEMDSPKSQAMDNLIKAILPDHPYGHSNTKILEELPNITIDDVKDFYYKTSLIPEKMTITVVGDINRTEVIKLLEEKFGSLSQSAPEKTEIPEVTLSGRQVVTLSSEDAAQAQIIQGWIGPAVSDDDFAATSLLNLILGSSGLSSRLFVELRDKKGLAYNVRSRLEALQSLGLLTVYIGTAPNNIKTCLEGFDVEINKIKTELVPEQELADAKTNYLGKRAFMHETNSQQAYYLGYYDIMGLGADFDKEIERRIKQVTSEDLLKTANKYFTGDTVVSMLAKSEYIMEK